MGKLMLDQYLKFRAVGSGIDAGRGIVVPANELNLYLKSLQIQELTLENAFAGLVGCMNEGGEIAG